MPRMRVCLLQVLGGVRLHRDDRKSLNGGFFTETFNAVSLLRLCLNSSIDDKSCLLSEVAFEFFELDPCGETINSQSCETLRLD